MSIDQAIRILELDRLRTASVSPALWSQISGKVDREHVVLWTNTDRNKLTGAVLDHTDMDGTALPLSTLIVVVGESEECVRVLGTSIYNKTVHLE